MRQPSKIFGAFLALFLSACATTYRPDPAVGPFDFTPEQCFTLSDEARDYTAVSETATYVASGSALLTGLLVGFLDSRTAPAMASGATLAASGVAVFAGSQARSLNGELKAGKCAR